MTPGSLGINCATFVGMRTGGVLGSLCASLGVLIPSLTLCLFAAIFLFKFKDNEYLKALMSGIRPASFGMIISVAITLSRTNFMPELGINNIMWNVFFIAMSIGCCMWYFKLTIPKSIILAAILGILFA